MCKHLWQPILPSSKEVDEEKRVDYSVRKLLARLGDVHYCSLCKRTAHVIKSRRSGMRLHHTNYFVETANKIRAEYGLPLLENCEKFITETTLQ